MEPFTREQVQRWVAETKAGVDPRSHLADNDQKGQYEAVLAEYKELKRAFGATDGPVYSDEDVVALVGVAIDRVFGPAV